ncbi:MAG: hypothetical protein L0170_09460 [Acidobacteria bacterium]|nr:hypothetical protein [Acidobacteriota bacterium]
MVKRKSAAAAEQPAIEDQPTATEQPAGTSAAPQDRQPGDEPEEPPRKKWTPPKNPFGFEGIKGRTDNRVHLLKSEIRDERGRTDIAWVIRFDHNPNLDPGPNGETYSKENPHPVLKYIKSEGFSWNFDPNDNEGGWGKLATGDAYGQDHIEARKVLAKAAEMIGAEVSQSRDPF